MLKKRLFPLVVVLSIALVAAIGLAFWQYQEAQASGLACAPGANAPITARSTP